MADLREFRVTLLTQSHAFASLLQAACQQAGVGRFSYAVRNFDFLNALTRQPADLLLIDEDRGSSFGLETLAHVRAKNAFATNTVPAIYLTRVFDSFEQAKALGVVRTIIKPASPRFITEMIGLSLVDVPVDNTVVPFIRPEAPRGDNVVSLFDFSPPH